MPVSSGRLVCVCCCLVRRATIHCSPPLPHGPLNGLVQAAGSCGWWPLHATITAANLAKNTARAATEAETVTVGVRQRRVMGGGEFDQRTCSGWLSGKSCTYTPPQEYHSNEWMKNTADGDWLRAVVTGAVKGSWTAGGPWILYPSLYPSPSLSVCPPVCPATGLPSLPSLPTLGFVFVPTQANLTNPPPPHTTSGTGWMHWPCPLVPPAEWMGLACMCNVHVCMHLNRIAKYWTMSLPSKVTVAEGQRSCHKSHEVVTGRLNINNFYSSI